MKKLKRNTKMMDYIDIHYNKIFKTLYIDSLKKPKQEWND